MSPLNRLLGKAAAALFAGVFLAAIPAPASEILPGGCVVVYDKENKPQGQCPLEHTDVDVDVSGFIARVTLTQRFSNPFTEPIEAVYTFPMSQRAAVDSMLMKVGNRTIRGNIKKREEAQRIYQEARDAGKTASLLDQERPNIFTQSVANILPGDALEITISYVEYLKYEDSEYEFSFPMVVGPRYIPGSPAVQPARDEQSPSPRPKDPRVVLGEKAGPDSTDQVPDAGRVNAPITPKGTRAGHDISLSVTIDAGMPLQEVKSELHQVDVQTRGNITAVALKQQNEIPNRDFVLKYKVAGSDIGDAVLTHAGAKGGFFSLVLQPPARVATENITPKEMIFVIDVSGSMSGFPIEKAKQTMRMCVEGMNPNDTFNLVSFAGGLGYCFEKSVSNTADNRKKALAYLDNLEGGGGTEMMASINAALGGPRDPEHLRVVCFMTDGYIGNEMTILDAIQQNAKEARVFAFGIGNSVNRFLIDGMARAGRGESEVVTLESDGDDATTRFHERIQNPVLTDITVDFGGLNVSEVFPDPGAIPDLFSAKPIVLTGRYTGNGDGAITVRGATASGAFERKIDVNFPAQAAEHDVLASLWARQRIEWLMEQDWKGIQLGNTNTSIKDDITKLGLEFGLMTQFTSFVAVEERVVTEGGRPKTVEVPVEMPDGVSYEGIFGSEAEMLQGNRVASLYAGVAGSPVPPMPASAPTNGPARVGRARADAAKSKEALPQLMEVEAKDEAASSTSKLAPSLVGLAGKVVNGKFDDGTVKVENGVVKVRITLNDMSEATLDALKKAGVTIVAERRSASMVLATIRVEDLDKLDKLDAVTKVEPSK